MTDRIVCRSPINLDGVKGLGEVVMAEPFPPERLRHVAPALTGDLSGLPPTFIGVGSLDLFLVEDVAYALRLSRAAVPVELHIYTGGIHGFDNLPGRLADQFDADLRSAIARMLHPSRS